MTKTANRSTTILTVTRNGKITLTKDLLGHMGVSPGDQIDIVLAPNGELIVEAARQGVANDDAAMNRRK